MIKSARTIGMTCLLVCIAASAMLAASPVAVVCSPGPNKREFPAAKEIRRHVYLRAGELPTIGQAVKGDAIGVATKERPIVDQLADAPLKTVIDKLERQQYVLKPPDCAVIQPKRRIRPSGPAWVLNTRTCGKSAVAAASSPPTDMSNGPPMFDWPESSQTSPTSTSPTVTLRSPSPLTSSV